MKKSKTKNINYNDLCNLIAQEVGYTSASSVNRYLKAIYKVILRQLQLNKRISFKDFGYFEIKERKNGERLIYDPTVNKKKIVYVKPKFSIFFKAYDKFDCSVNNDFTIVTNKELKAMKKKDSPMSSVADLLNKANERRKEE